LAFEDKPQYVVLMKKILTSGCVWSRVILIKVHKFLH